MVVMSLAELVLLGLVNSFGSNATAAYGAVNQVMGLGAIPGAVDLDFGLDLRRPGDRTRQHRPGRRHRPHRAGDECRFDWRPGRVIGYLFSRVLLGLFITDSAVLELAQGLLRIVLWSLVPFGMATVFSGIMRASGTAWRRWDSVFAIARSRCRRRSC